ncbi:Rnf103 [Symbiodinium natans]|uniref:Rnf103 protein n=1 Tax=Symbiodinium natans TaxID=878477 RepID=A0A812R9J9_9DINO|nr:Rnf103 [Symbiodinium natans]
MARAGVQGNLAAIAMWVLLGACLLLLGFAGVFFSTQVHDGPVRRCGSLMTTFMVLVMLGVVAQKYVDRCLDSRDEGLPQRSSRARMQPPKERHLVWSSCVFQDLAEAVSAFCKVYIGPDRTCVEGDASSVLPARKVAQDATCVCCLEDFAPSSEVAVLPCGHVYHRECIVIWSFSNSTSAGACPICRSSFEQQAV